MEKKKINKENFIQTSNKISETEREAIESDKKLIHEEIERNKRYLIEDILQDGEILYQEIIDKEKKKKTFWSRLIDFVFK